MDSAVYIGSQYKDLTNAKSYEIIDKRYHTWDSNNKFTDGIFIKNDLSIECWYSLNPYGIIQLAELDNKWIRYIGGTYSGFTNGKIYQTFKKYDRDYYYVLDDHNKFCGPRKTNFFGGQPLFEDITKEIVRDYKLEQILNELSY